MKATSVYVNVPKRGFKEGTARSFTAKLQGKLFEGFVVKKNGKFYAYRNLCRHLAITLDLKDGDFFTHDGNQLQCHMHGAIYEIESGYCSAGPCQGASLISLPILEEEGRVVVTVSQVTADEK